MWENASRWFGRSPPLDEARWIVVDVEASGLDVRRDRLLAIAAVAVHRQDDAAHRHGGRPRVRLGDSFEVVLRQPDAAAPPDKANILLHGIGVGAQREGIDCAAGLAAFAAWVGPSPLVAFHAAFDRAMLDRACREQGRPPLPAAWLDLAPLAAVLHPDVRGRVLDDWLAHFDIVCAVRHQAAADALATAELLLRLWPALRREVPRAEFRAVQGVAEAGRWMPG